MKVAYDPEADALYITLKGHGVDHTVPIGSDIALDYGPDGELHGIEILSASHHLNLSRTRPEILLDNLTPAPPK
ncbi:MAG: DUF2283 domain-containing protein [Terriglobia bacterium]